MKEESRQPTPIVVIGPLGHGLKTTDKEISPLELAHVGSEMMAVRLARKNGNDYEPQRHWESFYEDVLGRAEQYKADYVHVGSPMRFSDTPIQEDWNGFATYNLFATADFYLRRQSK